MKIQSALLIGAAAVVFAQTENLPTPYRTVRDFGELPLGMKWAAVTGVEPAPDGGIYVIHRCFENSCAGRAEPPILHFDKSGKLIKSWVPACSSFRTDRASMPTATSGSRTRKAETAGATRVSNSVPTETCS